MDFLKKFAGSTTETTDKSTPSDQQSDLFSSAKLVADAARSTFQNEPEKKYENAEVAGAAADLLDAAQTYGKLDKTSGIGSYVEKAESYLHGYEASHSTKPKTSEEPKPSAEKKVEDPSESAKPTSEEPKAEKEEEPSELAKPSTDSEEKTSGLGDYAKIAEGFLKKDGDSGEGDEKGGAGVGDYVKMAEGFVNKPSGGSKTDGDESSNAGGDLLKFAGGFLGKN